MALKRNFLWMLVIGLALGTASCGKKSPPRENVYPVVGKITIDGKPTGARIQVMLTRSEFSASYKASSAFTRTDGTFVIATYGEDDGAPAGTYAVTVASTDNGRDASLAKITQNYSDPKNPAATVVVKEQPANDLGAIDLKSKK